MHTKISSAHKAFLAALSQWERFDRRNQRAFSAAGINKVSLQQLHVLTEAVLTGSFRAYEGYVREVFLLYARGKTTKGGGVVRSFLTPLSALHAEQLMKQSKPFLDWSSPDTVIQRAETFLQSGAPIKLALSSSSASIKSIKAVRNHIAHESEESLSSYKKVVLAHFGTLPIQIPTPGDFLLRPSTTHSGIYLLKEYLDTLRHVADGLAG